MYLTGTFGTSAAETSANLSPIGIAGACGAWMGGAMAIRLGWRPVVVAALLTSCILMVSIPLQSSAALIIAVAILTGWIVMLFAAPIQSLFSFVVPVEWSGLAAGYFNTIGFIGAFRASLVFGFLVDWFSTFTVGWLWVASVLVVGIVAALLLPVASRINSTPSP